MKEGLSVVIADDHPIFRSGLVHIISMDSGLTVVGEAGDGETALSLIMEKKPAVAVLDVEMPKMSGLEVARIVQERELDTRLVVLTIYADEEVFNEAMDLGVSGYVLKENAVSEVLNSIRGAAEGRYYISPNISGFLVSRSNRRSRALASMPALGSLTPAEWRILRLIAGNKTSKEIAHDLCISPKTVENHRANIADKLDLRGNHALLRFVLEHRSLF